MRYSAALRIAALTFGSMVAGLLISSSASASVDVYVDIATAYFPGGAPIETFNDGGSAHFTESHESGLIFFTLYVVKGHSDTPSNLWFEAFLDGQEASIEDGHAEIVSANTLMKGFVGEFSLVGKVEGERYEKLCKLIMDEDNYGTWCVAGLIEDNVLRQLIARLYLLQKDSFILYQ